MPSLGAALLMSLLASSLSAADPADLVLLGGRVWPGKGLARGTALAARGERIVAVGSDEAVRGLIGPKTRAVELRGRLVVPGFNDAHVHFIDGGFGLLSVDLRDCKDEEEFTRRIAEHAAKQPPSSWILNGNWDHHRWPSKREPTRALLDAVTPDHPVFVNRLDGHMALANSLALARAGIDGKTPDVPGGTIVRDARGEPTGLLKDNAMELVARAIPPPSREQNRGAARAALAEAARFGVTTIQDNSPVDALPTYQDLRAAGDLTARLYVWRYAGESLAPLRSAGVRTGLGDDWIRLGALKILADGSIGSATAALFEPFTSNPASTGLLLHARDELFRLVREADAAGFALAVHAIGDRANSLVLEAFAEAASANGPRDRRFRIEHAQHVRAQDLHQFRALGVVASVQPSHCIDDMRFVEKHVGKSRLQDAYRWKSFLDAGVTLAFGTDWFVEPLDPRLGLYAAVTREYPEGGPAGGFEPQEKVSLEDALDAYTRGSAYAEFAEKEKGTLAPGKLADLVVFAADLFEVEPRAILTTPVDLTVVGGRAVFERRP
jgi:predicted amidohydrolase YtcJ